MVEHGSNRPRDDRIRIQKQSVVERHVIGQLGLDGPVKAYEMMFRETYVVAGSDLSVRVPASDFRFVCLEQA